MKKVGRNDPCPCGSGKKYKKCCLDKADDVQFSNPLNFLSSYKEVRKNSKIKQCLHPNKAECSEKIIGAHSIQNNKILKKISDDGLVYMPCPKPDKPFAPMTPYGRKEASVFTGFCGYHDKTLFQPIEDSDFVGTDEQIFLYVYRCFAAEYHKKQEMIKMEQNIFAKRPSLINSGIDSPFEGMHIAVNDLELEKKIFDNAILTKKYDVLTSIVWKFDGHSNFAGSGFEAPTKDLQGTVIQDLLNLDKIVGHIFLTVFPEGDFTYAIIAWVHEYDDLFKGIKQQLSALSDDKKKIYINNTLPTVSENIAMKPSSWKKLSKIQKNDFHKLIYFHDTLSDLIGKKFDRLSKPTFDLFEL